MMLKGETFPQTALVKAMAQLGGPAPRMKRIFSSLKFSGAYLVPKGDKRSNLRTCWGYMAA